MEHVKATDDKFHYVYLITNKLTNMMYIGKRTSKLHPTIDLGRKYKSSSGDPAFINDQKINPHNYTYNIIASFQSSRDAKHIFTQYLMLIVTQYFIIEENLEI